MQRGLTQRTIRLIRLPNIFRYGQLVKDVLEIENMESGIKLERAKPVVRKYGKRHSMECAWRVMMSYMMCLILRSLSGNGDRAISYLTKYVRLTKNVS